MYRDQNETVRETQTAFRLYELRLSISERLLLLHLNHGLDILRRPRNLIIISGPYYYP